jgi:hypothetical protein
MNFKEEFVVVSAIDVTDTKWLRGQPTPLDATIKVCEMFLNGGESADAGSIRVFALPKDGTPNENTKGSIITIANPMVRFIAMLGPKRLWDEELEEIDPDLEVDEVVDVRGQTWRVGGDVPEDGSGFRIEKIVNDNESVWVYATVPKQSAWEKQGLAMKFILPRFTFVSSNGSFAFEDWSRLLREAEGKDESPPAVEPTKPQPSLTDMANDPAEAPPAEVS